MKLCSLLRVLRVIRILKTSNWSSNPLLHLHVSPPQSQKHLDPTRFCLHPFTCPIITLRHYCTLLFTENTDKAFQCSFSKLNHSFFFFSFLAQRDITDGPQDQSENHNIYQPSLVQGQPQNSDRQTDTALPQTGRNKQGPHSPHSKNLLTDRQGWAGKGSFLCSKEWGAADIGEQKQDGEG